MMAANTSPWSMWFDASEIPQNTDNKITFLFNNKTEMDIFVEICNLLQKNDGFYSFCKSRVQTKDDVYNLSIFLTFDPNIDDISLDKEIPPSYSRLMNTKGNIERMIEFPITGIVSLFESWDSKSNDIETRLSSIFNNIGKVH